jgi:hypothetical protein
MTRIVVPDVGTKWRDSPHDHPIAAHATSSAAPTGAAVSRGLSHARTGMTRKHGTSSTHRGPNASAVAGNQRSLSS